MAHPAAMVSGIIGNIVSFLVYFAPLTTFRQVFREKTTGGFSSLPYVVAFFSSALWVFYALLKTNAHLLLSINSIGCGVEAGYVVFFVLYAPRNGRLKTARSVLLGCMIMVVVMAVTLKGLPPSHRVKFLGSVCLASTMVVFVAPLSVIVKVVRTKSVEFLPIGLSSCLVLSAVAWFMYGFFTKDNFVMYPNVAGFLFSCIQVALYFWYRNSGKNDGGEPPGVELGAAV